MNFAYQCRHAPAKLTSMVASSMVAAANFASVSTSNRLADTGCSDHVTPDLSQLSLLSQATNGNKTVTVGNGQELLVTYVGNGKLITPSHHFCWFLDPLKHNWINLVN